MNKASHISRVKLENTLDSAFRLQTIYVPQQFVEVAANTARYKNWFRGEQFTFKVFDAKSNAEKTITLTWNEMLVLGLLNAPAEGADDYTIDIEKYLRLCARKDELAAQGKSSLDIAKAFGMPPRRRNTRR